jgi:hypothetical protein
MDNIDSLREFFANLVKLDDVCSCAAANSASSDHVGRRLLNFAVVCSEQVDER